MDPAPAVAVVRAVGHDAPAALPTRNRKQAGPELASASIVMQSPCTASLSPRKRPLTVALGTGAEPHINKRTYNRLRPWTWRRGKDPPGQKLPPSPIVVGNANVYRSGGAANVSEERR